MESEKAKAEQEQAQPQHQAAERTVYTTIVRTDEAGKVIPLISKDATTRYAAPDYPGSPPQTTLKLIPVDVEREGRDRLLDELTTALRALVAVSETDLLDYLKHNGRDAVVSEQAAAILQAVCRKLAKGTAQAG